MLTIPPSLFYASVHDSVVILNPNTASRPEKSFIDTMASSAAPSIPVKPTLLHRGESIVYFSAKKV